MTPSWIGRFAAHDFVGSATACEGRQIALVLRAVAEVAPDLVWFGSDVRGPGSSFWSRFRGPYPGRVGLADEAAREAEAVSQFESGVLVGVPASVARPRYRDGGVWTEDADDADLGDGVVEIRAFDTSYVMVATTSAEVRTRLAQSAGARL